MCSSVSKAPNKLTAHECVFHDRTIRMSFPIAVSWLQIIRKLPVKNGREKEIAAVALPLRVRCTCTAGLEIMRCVAWHIHRCGDTIAATLAVVNVKIITIIDIVVAATIKSH